MKRKREVPTEEVLEIIKEAITKPIVFTDEEVLDKMERAVRFGNAFVNAEMSKIKRNGNKFLITLTNGQQYFFVVKKVDKP